MCRSYIGLAADYYDTEKGPYEVNIANNDDPRRTFTDLMNGQIYRVEVECYNVAGWSSRARGEFSVGIVPEAPILYEEKDCRELDYEWEG